MAKDTSLWKGGRGVKSQTFLHSQLCQKLTRPGKNLSVSDPGGNSNSYFGFFFWSLEWSLEAFSTLRILPMTTPMTKKQGLLVKSQTFLHSQLCQKLTRPGKNLSVSDPGGNSNSYFGFFWSLEWSLEGFFDAAHSSNDHSNDQIRNRKVETTAPKQRPKWDFYVHSHFLTSLFPRLSTGVRCQDLGRWPCVLHVRVRTWLQPRVKNAGRDHRGFPDT